MHYAVADRRPGKMSLVQPLRHQHHAAAIPCQKLHSVRALAAEHEDVAAIWVRAQCFAHQRRQRVHRLAKVDRLCRQYHLEVGPQSDQRMPRSADSTVESVASSTPGSTRMRAPLTSISITPPGLPGRGDICSGGTSCADASRSGSSAVAGPLSEVIRTGTKPGASRPVAVANLCRHTVSSPRTTPWRRATSE